MKDVSLIKVSRCLQVQKVCNANEIHFVKSMASLLHDIQALFAERQFSMHEVNCFCLKVWLQIIGYLLLSTVIVRPLQKLLIQARPRISTRVFTQKHTNTLSDEQTHTRTCLCVWKMSDNWENKSFNLLPEFFHRNGGFEIIRLFYWGWRNRKVWIQCSRQRLFA